MAAIGLFSQFGRTFEVVWNGTADRQGICPSLLPDFSRQSTLAGIQEQPRSKPRGAGLRDRKRRDRQYQKARAEARALWGNA